MVDDATQKYSIANLRSICLASMFFVITLTYSDVHSFKPGGVKVFAHY